MRVKLDNIRVAKSYLTDKVYAGIIDKDGSTWKSKTDITNDFLAAVIARFKGSVEEITDGENTYQITVKKVKNAKNNRGLSAKNK